MAEGEADPVLGAALFIKGEAGAGGEPLAGGVFGAAVVEVEFAGIVDFEEAGEAAFDVG